MPKFIVYAGHDAFYVMKAVIEAENEQDALNIALAGQGVITWTSEGVTQVFDDLTVFTEEGSVVPYDGELEIERDQHALSKEELDTIIAALRYYQMEYAAVPPDIMDIAEDGHGAALTIEEIDDLVERLNA